MTIFRIGARARRSEKPGPADDGDKVFADGPFKKNGAWLPEGGRELYFHSHLSEPDEVDTPAADDPIDDQILKEAGDIIEKRNVSDLEKDPDKRAALDSDRRAALTRKFSQLIRTYDKATTSVDDIPELTSAAPQVVVRHDRAPFLRGRDGQQVALPTDGILAG